MKYSECSIRISTREKKRATQYNMNLFICTRRIKRNVIQGNSKQNSFLLVLLLLFVRHLVLSKENKVSNALTNHHQKRRREKISKIQLIIKFPLDSFIKNSYNAMNKERGIKVCLYCFIHDFFSAVLFFISFESNIFQ